MGDVQTYVCLYRGAEYIFSVCFFIFGGKKVRKWDGYGFFMGKGTCSRVLGPWTSSQGSSQGYVCRPKEVRQIAELRPPRA
jgi:hypothetical protein